jgi:hypothetical protein
MPIPTILRRLRKVEAALALEPEYPPFTSPEIEDIARRGRAGESLTKLELYRIKKQSPIVDGEFIIAWCRGDVSIKHYIGIDMSAL